MTRQSARVPAAILCLAGSEIAAAAWVGGGEPWWCELRYRGWVGVEASVVEAHEGFFVFFGDGGCVILRVELGVTVLYVASPFVGYVGLELGGFACACAFWDDDACAQGQVVRVFVFVDWCDEVSKGILINVGQVIVIGVVGLHVIDAWWEGVGPIRGSDVRWHGCDEIFEGSKG